MCGKYNKILDDTGCVGSHKMCVGVKREDNSSFWSVRIFIHSVGSFVSVGVFLAMFLASNSVFCWLLNETVQNVRFNGIKLKIRIVLNPTIGFAIFIIFYGKGSLMFANLKFWQKKLILFKKYIFLKNSCESNLKKKKLKSPKMALNKSIVKLSILTVFLQFISNGLLLERK